MLSLASVKSALNRERYNDMKKGSSKSIQFIVENERRISLIQDGQLIDGTIDRLVIVQSKGKPIAAEIIDYKTDRWEGRDNLEDWLRQRVSYHRPQMKAYTQVVSRMLQLPIEKINCSLLFLSADACVRADEHAPPAPHLKYKQLTLVLND